MLSLTALSGNQFFLNLKLVSLLKITLGTVQFGQKYGIANKSGQVTPAEVQKILGYAREQGINSIDTAIAYGNSETVLGEIGVKDWRIVSKLPDGAENIDDIVGWVIGGVEQSLERLKVDRLHGLLLHRSGQLLMEKGEQLYQALQQLKLEGLVEKIGVSIYDPSELDILCDYYTLDVVQSPFNILDHRILDSHWYGRMIEQGTELHVRSIFLQGLLLMRSSGRPVAFNRWQALWDSWEHWLDEYGMTPVEACVRYALSIDDISQVIIGVESVDQLQEIISSIDGDIPLLPPEWHCIDTDLLNPSQWGGL
jgi:aryl-alcohol dehydrogenase-like predicted oxidoreductase